MERRKVAMGLSDNQTRGPAEAPTSPQDFTHYFGKLIVYTLFFGIVSAALSSRLPLLIGAILFFSNDDFIAWVLGKIGIQIVPDSIGANFINACVFLTGAWAVFTYAKDSLPAPLAAWAPPNFSWAFIGGGAIGCVVLALAVTGCTRLLSWVGLDVRPDSLAGATVRALIGFGLLGLLYLLLSSPTLEAWFGGN